MCTKRKKKSFFHCSFAHSLWSWLLDHHSPGVYGGFKKEPERMRRVFQHMASVAMIVICSDSQVESVFIQLVFFVKT